jgi:signal peptidase I
MKRAIGAVLRGLIRGRRERGGSWGEAMLAEYDEIAGRWEALRWAGGVVPVVLRERLAGAGRRRRVVLGLAALAVVLAAVGSFVLTPSYMPSGAMNPAVPIGSRFVVDKVGFRLTGLRRGDIVELSVPEAQVTVVKRVIGLPGDAIACRDGRVLRDGVPIEEPYLPAGTRTECASVNVPQGAVYVLGDNRDISADSREWGPVKRSAIAGRLMFTL